jgi:hypothetical protein
VVSGEAGVKESANVWSLQGKLTADGAYFRLPKMPPPSLSSDVIVQNKRSQKTAGEPDANAKKVIRTRLDMTFDMGPKFVFVGRGLDTGLAGSLRLRSADGSPLQANGSISTRNGLYEGYGQQLEIERGILNFQGPPLNPGLNILAVRPDWRHRWRGSHRNCCKTRRCVYIPILPCQTVKNWRGWCWDVVLISYRPEMLPCCYLLPVRFLAVMAAGIFPVMLYKV